MSSRIGRSLLLAILALVHMPAGCMGKAAEPAGPQANASQEPSTSRAAPDRDLPPDEPLETYRLALLEMAFDTASAIPVQPHLKDRARQQAAAAAACLQLSQPSRALEMYEAVGNWRRGLGYANIAMYCARNGHPRAVPTFLNRAEELSEIAQDWRKDSIRVRIAQVHACLGHDEQADAFEAGSMTVQDGKVEQAEAERGEASYAEQMERLEAIIALGEFDGIRNAIAAMTELYDNSYGNAARRTEIEAKIRDSWSKLPLLIRIETLLSLAEAARKHADGPHALELVAEARAMKLATTWIPRYGVPISARIAVARFLAGEPDEARSDLRNAREEYRKDRSRTLITARSGILRSVAEAHAEMGDADEALAMYRRAVDVGSENPNARPRALDLAGVCRSMALHGTEPDEALWARMREIYNGLDQPW